MSGTIQFNVEVFIKGGEIPSWMSNRINDLSSFFNTVIDEWTKDNETKFSGGIGAESSGAQIDPGVFWKPLSPAYLEQKQKDGLGGGLMVRTGSLKAALTDPGMIMRDVAPDHARFGEPLDPFDALKVMGNWDTRQAIFFSGRDQMMVKEKLIKHLTPDAYNGMTFAQKKGEIAQMDAEFYGVTGIPE